MPFICKMCEKCPNSHSLVKFYESDKQIIYYTNPSNAKNNETNGIISHYDGVLSETNGKECIWILDLNGFGMKQFLEIGNAIALSKLITEKYSDKFKKIIVINGNSYINSIYIIIKPFLNSKIQNIIFFSNKNHLSSLTPFNISNAVYK